MRKMNSVYVFKRILLQILFLGCFFILDAQEKQNKNGNSQVGLDFYCQGNYLEIEGVKYYEGEKAFVCIGLGQFGYIAQIEAHHVDGSLFPTNTEWNGVPNSSSGPNALLSSFDPSPSINGQTVQAYYFDGANYVSVSIEIVFISINVKENINQQFGYDPNYNDIEQYYPSHDFYYSWKSIEIGGTDFVNIEMYPEGIFQYVTFVSSNSENFSVLPVQANNDIQILTLNGSALGSAIVDSHIGKTTSCSHEQFKSQFRIIAYPNKTEFVKIVLIEEENDDIQEIDFGKGKSNSIAIKAVAGGILKSIPNPNSDDELVGNEITTGSDGICQTIADPDDVQLIEFMKGKGYQTCIRPGGNEFRDTPEKGGDDEIVNDLEINTGANGVCETYAKNINSNFLTSSQIDANELIMNLQNIYKQAVLQWEYLIPQISIEVINYDLNRDGKLKGSVGGFSNEEIDEIIENCVSCSPIDCNLILLDESDLIDPLGGGEIPGFSLKGGKKYSFAFRSASDWEYYLKTTAHELGHCAFDLQHPFQEFQSQGYPSPLSGVPTDDKNLMDYKVAPEYKLRKYQWDQIHY